MHHNYILQAFVLKMVICTSYFFINNFPSFLKAKIAFEIGLLLRLCSLGFGLNTICCSLTLEHSAQHLSNLVLGEQSFAYNITFYYRGFKQLWWFNKAHVSKYELVLLNIFGWYQFVIMFKLESIGVSWKFVYISSYSTIKYAYCEVVIWLSFLSSFRICRVVTSPHLRAVGTIVLKWVHIACKCNISWQMALKVYHFNELTNFSQLLLQWISRFH